MEKTEPTFVPEWLKNNGSFPNDDQGVSKSLRTKSLVNNNIDNDLVRTSVSNRTTSSYFRRTSSSNGGSHLRSYSSFGRNNRDNNRDWDKDRDYLDPLSNILPSRFEKEGLRRSHSSLSAKRVDPWPRKVGGDKNGHNGKAKFEKDFPSLLVEENKVDSEIGRMSAIQSLPIGNSGGDVWTSALVEVPMMNGSVQNTTSTCDSATANVATNMAETLKQGPSRAQTTPQLNVGTQRLEELAVKQSRQLIPVTPSMPKTLASNSSDKPKLKVGQLQLQNSHIVNHSPNLRPVSVKPDVTKASTLGKLHILKSSRERNSTTSTPKESSSPTKLPNCPPAAPSLVVGSASLRNSNPNLNSNSTILVERKPSVEKRPSPQAQSRNDFFNLMRKKSMANKNNNTSNPVVAVASESGSSDSTNDNKPDGVHIPSENKVDLVIERFSNNEKNDSSNPDVILYSEEEEARFLRSLGWEETTEEEGLTEEEINSFYRDVSKYVNLKTTSNFFKGMQGKSLMPLNLRMGKIGDISANSKVDS